MKKSMILVAVTDNTNRTKLKSMLEQSYFVVEASNFRQAEILISQNHDLIDASIISEDINHNLIINDFKALGDVPTVIMVGLNIDNEKQKKLKLDGLAGFVTYSIKKDVMIDSIEKIIAKANAEKALKNDILKQASSKAKSSVDDERNSFGSFRIDLKRQVLCYQTGFILDIMKKHSLKTLKELIQYFSNSLVYYPKDKFNEDLSFENIYSSINDGKKPIKLKELFNFNGHVYCIDISVSNFTDIETSTTYALVLMQDKTDEYQEKKLEAGIFEKEYDLIASINVYTQIVNVQINNGILSNKNDKALSYKSIQGEIAAHFSQEGEEDALFKKIEIDSIISNLEFRQLYDIITIINQTRLVFYRINFRYLDEFQETIILYIENITGLKEVDFVTGSLNYQGFLNKCFDEMYQSRKSYSIINCNCSNYKDIIEFVSVDAINQFLKDFCYTLKKSFTTIHIGRSSADSFWILTETKNLNSELFTELKNVEIRGDNKIFFLNVCFGVYQVPEAAKIISTKNVDIYCERARMTLSFIKEGINKNFAYFNETVNEEYLRNTAIVNDVIGGLERNEFSVFYQPIYSIDGKKIVAAEALVRWNHKDFGYVSPAILIPAIEANGMVTTVDSFVINKTDGFLKKLNNDGINIPISVNLSRLDFFDNDVVELVKKIAKDNAKKKHMNFEVTESYYIEISANISSVLEQLRANGAKILLDDFGDGFSSFRALISTDFDVIKIYKGMVDQIGLNKTSEEAIKAIVTMAHSVGLKVIAEGVEHPSQLKFLKKSKCDFIQGYIFSKPVCELEFYHMLTNKK